MKSLSWLLLACCWLSPVRADAPEDEAPRVRAALEQGLAAEEGSGVGRNLRLAAALYCDAGVMGSPEGFFRVGRLLARARQELRNVPLANAFLALAASLGHGRAPELFDEAVPAASLPEDQCADLDIYQGRERFDLEAYLSGLPVVRRRVAALIREQAPRFGVDARLALAVALAESNLNAQAISPKNAQGVMQLIPETQARFGVRQPFDAASNIRGGLAYLRWLADRYGGDPERVVAAYNAGEGAVERYRGVPPFRETRQYVRRVLFFSGFPASARG